MAPSRRTNPGGCSPIARLTHAVIPLAAIVMLLSGCEEHDIGQPCARCGNDRVDGFETDVDCGGPCKPCNDGAACRRGGDCVSGFCDTLTGACATDPGGTPVPSRTLTDERVAQDLTFPCEELICVATEGRPGYCSRKCRSDQGCPSGFVCKEMQPIDGQPFSGERYCVWKPCRERSDCGATQDFCCRPVEGADPVEEINLCDFSNDGKCG